MTEYGDSVGFDYLSDKEMPPTKSKNKVDFLKSETKYSEQGIKQKPKNMKDSLCNLAKQIWMGLGFFSMDLTKVPKLNKEPIQWTDRFKDPFDWLINMLALLIFGFLILPVI